MINIMVSKRNKLFIIRVNDTPLALHNLGKWLFEKPGIY